MTPDMTGYSQDDLHDMTTTDLLRIIETERLTAREMRVIRAEIDSRRI